MNVPERRVALGDLGVVQRLEVGLVGVVDLELAGLDEAELDARQGRLDRALVGLVPVLDQELFARRVGDVRLDRRQVDELRLGDRRVIQALAVFQRKSALLASDSRMKLRLTSQPRSNPHFDDT